MIKSKALCVGCRDDFYNDKNQLGIKECCFFKQAKVVERFKIGWWDQPRPENFELVTTLDCHNAPGSYALYKERP